MSSQPGVGTPTLGWALPFAAYALRFRIPCARLFAAASSSSPPPLAAAPSRRGRPSARSPPLARRAAAAASSRGAAYQREAASSAAPPRPPGDARPARAACSRSAPCPARESRPFAGHLSPCGTWEQARSGRSDLGESAVPLRRLRADSTAPGSAAEPDGSGRLCSRSARVFRVQRSSWALISASSRRCRTTAASAPARSLARRTAS